MKTFAEFIIACGGAAVLFSIPHEWVGLAQVGFWTIAGGAALILMVDR